MLVYKCDRCGKDITKENYLSRAILDGQKIKYKIKGILMLRRIEREPKDISVDLCLKCSNEFLNWLGKDFEDV